jgi:hypothetical protein
MTRVDDKPLPSPYDAWFVVAIVVVGVLLVLLNFSGLEKRIVYAVRPILPDWFPTLNLLLAPILAPLPTMRLGLRIRAELRFFLLVLVLCSLSLYRLSFDMHPVATLLLGVFVYVEMFWLIPKWNSSHPAPGQVAGL